MSETGLPPCSAGFLSSTIIEAATGRGIIGQVVLYLKALNILGPQSGF